MVSSICSVYKRVSFCLRHDCSKVATVLVQEGTLSKGACIVAGDSWAKVRTLWNDQGRVMSKATPSMAVEVSGWRELPSAGDHVELVDSEVGCDYDVILTCGSYFRACAAC